MIKMAKEKQKNEPEVTEKEENTAAENTEEPTKETDEESETSKTEADDKCAELEKKCAELEKKCAELSDKYLRTLAEYDNYRKRTIKEKESIYPEAKAVVVEKFLDVLDNLERALETAQQTDSLYEGVCLVKKQMDDVLKSLGAEVIKTEGESFDPKLHEAVMHIEDESLEENIIVEEFRKGYRIGDRVVRHSIVKVAN